MSRGGFTDPTDFWRKLPVVFDGGISSELYNRGCPFEEPPELWAADNPKIVEELHADYCRAGATVATTATFGLMRRAYAGEIDVSRAADVVRAVVTACRNGVKAVNPSTLIGGSIGATARLPQEIEESRLRAAVEPMIDGMTTCGVSFILLETQSSLRETIALVSAVRQLSDLPMVISFAFAWHGRTLDDFTPGQAVEETLRYQPVAYGCNCAPDAVGMVRILQQMAPVADDIPVLLRPNAGIPRLVNGQQVYSISPDRLADLAGTYWLDGARLFGGCCGTTPEHIAAVTARLSYRTLPTESDET